MARKPKRVQIKDLAAVTKSSVQAAVGKTLLQKTLLQDAKPGILTGLLLNEKQLAALDRTPIEIAKEIAKGVGATSGVRVTPGVQKLPDAVFVGYLVPKIARP